MRTNQNVKKVPVTDWHPADIIAALKKRGTNLSKLSMENGLSRGGLYRHYPKAERIIANEIGVAPSEIWGSRYSNR